MILDAEDNYIWLEDLNSERTLEFVNNHNKRLKEFLGEFPEKIYSKIEKYHKMPYIIDFSPTDSGIYILSRFWDKYAINLLSTDGKVQEIISSKDIGPHVVISGLYPSQKGDKIAFFYTEAGSDLGKVRITDIRRNQVIDEFEGSIWDVIWKNENKIFYSKFYRSGKTPDGVEAPADRIIERDIFEKSEEMTFGRGLDRNYMIGLEEISEENWIFCVVQYGWNFSKIYGGPKDDPSKWSLILDGKDSLAIPFGYADGYSYVIIYDKNGFGRIIKVKDGITEEIIPEGDYPINKALLLKDKIVVVYLIDASSKIKIYDLNGNIINEIVPEEPLTIKKIKEYCGKIYAIIESFSKPPSLYEINEDGFRKIFGTEVQLDISVDEEFIESKDGTKIHVFTVYNKKKRNNIAVVYGYGGFGVSITPHFSPSIASLLEDGFTYVVANIRGGGEYGEKWHKMGMKENKQNVFDDFASVLRTFKQRGFKTVAWGSSNGGLLVASVLTQNPDVIDVALVGYPVIDMMRFHKLYIGYLWTTEYGNPDDPQDKVYLMKYSPYHNVRHDIRYPATLVYTGLHDDRVHPGHALKFVAKLEEAGAPVYLRVETKSGHMGASPEIKIREMADIAAFIYKSLGVED